MRVSEVLRSLLRYSAPGLALVLLLELSLTTTTYAQIPGYDPARIDYQSLYAIVGTMYQIDPDLLRAIARIESAGNPNAVSPKGAQGLMQLIPSTASQFGVADPFDPIQNTLGAARYLDYLRRRGMGTPIGSLPEILAGYNAGEKGAKGYAQGRGPAETRQYVRDVLLEYLLDGKVPRHHPPSFERHPPSFDRHLPTAKNPPVDGKRDAVLQIQQIIHARDSALKHEESEVR